MTLELTFLSLLVLSGVMLPRGGGEAPVSKGLVQGADGRPLEGVRVVTVGSYDETYSDKAGRFDLPMERSAILVFAKQGYHPIMVPLPGVTNADLSRVILKPALAPGERRRSCR